MYFLLLSVSSGEYWGGDQVMDSDTAAAYEQFLRDMHSTSGSMPACAEPSNGDPTCHFNGFMDNRP